MPTEADIALRILVAVLLGAAIGLERELTGQMAGLRTHITVALGAALFGLVSAYSFGEFIQARAATNYQVDVTRIASNVVTGVGFLAGGVIIKHGASVRGLTTAASLWVTAAVGLAVGLGSYFMGAAATVALIVTLALLRAPRRWLRRFAVSKETVIIQLRPDADTAAVIGALQHVDGLDVRSLTLRAGNGSGTVVHADVKGTELEARLATLAERDDVTDVDIAG
ncbi:MAG: MgtC/SapB family protein [Actinomycetota bacterium]|nr:MgtC/SapB family protein [Actinomycetota bacterium]